MLTDDHVLNRRHQLLTFYRSALARVQGERVVSEYLAQNSIAGEWAVVAVGKAAAAMALGAQQQLGDRIHSGLVITRHGYSEPRLVGSRWQIIESAHPIPDESSLQAGDTLLQFLQALPPDVPLLFFLSGGASTLVEVLPDGVTLDDLSRTNEWLLAAGLSIAEMNAVRCRLSRLKGGRLVRHLGGRRCLQLLISDVPGDDPGVIGSAPLWPTDGIPTTEVLPRWLSQLLLQGDEPPSLGDPAFSTIETHIIADNRMALQAIKTEAEAQGLKVYLHAGHFQGEAQVMARRFVQKLQQGLPGLHLWGGESSVALPRLHGHGGRSQHLALAAAELLDGDERIMLLAAGSDGSDGPGEAAGALVDGGTRQRGEDEGFSLALALANADSGSFLAASGDLIETGPTGTNVMDLVIGWKVGED